MTPLTSISPEPARLVDTGRARTAVLLLHGLCSTPLELMHVQAALRSAGHTVAAPLIPGYSFDASTFEQHAAPFMQWLASIALEVERLRADHERVLLVGISAGAALALGAALRLGERLDGLVLMSTPLRLDGWAVPRTQCLLPLALYTPLGRWWRYREREPYGVKNERVRGWIARELAQRRISRAGAAVIGIGHLREHDRLVRHVRRDLPLVRCPRVLALHAREDEVASPANLELLARAFGRERLRTVVLQDSYHMISIDNDRHRVAQETVAFADAVALA